MTNKANRDIPQEYAGVLLRKDHSGTVTHKHWLLFQSSGERWLVVFISHRRYDWGQACFPLKHLELQTKMPFPWSEFASSTISKWQVIITGVTQAHRVTSKLLFPLLRTAGDRKAFHRVIYVDFCKPIRKCIDTRLSNLPCH